MKINGEDISTQTMMPEFFKNIDFSKVSDEPLPEYSERDVERVLKESSINGNIPARFAKTRFDDYEWICKDEVRTFALTPKNDGVYLLFGTVGTGKTSLMAAAMHERALNDMNSGEYFSMLTLMPKLRTTRSFKADENEEQFFNRLSKASFLCLDEIGTCENPVEERNFLRTVIAMRYDNCLPTIIATNLTPTQFKMFLCDRSNTNLSNEEVKNICAMLDKSDPILNRLKSVSKATNLVGESYRNK